VEINMSGIEIRAGKATETTEETRKRKSNPIIKK